MAIAVYVAGFRKYQSGIPLFGSCSLEISAACHPFSSMRVDVEQHKVQWGDVGRNDDDEKSKHATFTDGPVSPMLDGGIYSRSWASMRVWRWCLYSWSPCNYSAKKNFVFTPDVGRTFFEGLHTCHADTPFIVIPPRR